MAEIVDQLRLDIDQALRDIGRVESALNNALAPIEVRVDTTQARNQLDQLARNADQALGDVDVNIDSAGAARLNDELADVERNLAQADSEADQLTSSLNRADRAAADINVTSGALVGSFGNLRTAAAGIASALAAIGIGQGLGLAARGANAAIQSFAQLEDSINAVNVVFREGARTVFEFGEIAARSAGLSQEAFNNAVAPIGALLTNFGFDAQEAAAAAVTLIQRGADLASVYGGSVQDALLAINSALVGQVEPLRRFGGEISAARVEAFALATGLLQAGETMDNTVAVQARFGLILKDTAVVAGDFVNTSEDLANAQRIAAAEALNLQSVFGEALAPALEAILVQAVPILNFFESLTPALADNAAAAAEAAAGITEFVSAIVLGLGGLGDVIGGAGDALQAFPGLILDVADAAIDWDFSFSRVNDQLDQFNQRTANQFIRVASQSIPAAIAKGMDPINAFGQAIAFLAEQDDGLLTIQQAFERLRIQSGLLDPQVQAVVRSLLAQADTLKLNAGEVDFLQRQLNGLNEALDDGGRANQEYMATFAGITGEVLPALSALELVQVAAAEAGLSMSDLALGVDPVARALTETLTPAQQTALVLGAIGEDAAVAAGILEANLRPAIADVSGALEDLNEDGRITKEEFITNLREMTAAAIETAVGLASISTFSPETAAALAALPIEQAIDLVKQFRGDEAAIQAAAEAITGTPEQLGQAILEIYGDALRVLQGGDRKAIDTFLAQLATDIEEDVPGVTDAFTALFQPALSASFADLEPPPLTPTFTASVEGMDAAQITASLDEVLFASFADVTPPDLTSQVVTSIQGWDSTEIADAVETAITANVNLYGHGAEAFSTYIAGFVSAPSDAISKVRDSIEGVISSATQRQSPPKMFLDFGREAGAAYWDGFNQAELTLRSPAPSITGSINPGTVGGVSGGVHIELTTVNPIQQDQVSDVARMAQQASSIANSYRSVVPNGM